MPTEVELPSVTRTPMHCRDTPLHFNEDSASKAVGFELFETLKAIEEPWDDIPEDAKTFDFEIEDLPGLFVPHHCIELKSKIRIMGALKFRYEYL